MTTLTLRADAGPGLGLGHLARCVAYAEEAAGSGDPVAAELAECVETARVRMVSENIDAADMLGAYEPPEGR